MEYKGNAGEITPRPICHLRVKPSSNKIVKVVTSDISIRYEQKDAHLGYKLKEINFLRRGQ